MKPQSAKHRASEWFDRTLARTFGSLLALLALTVLLAHAGLGPLATVTGLLIAGVKAGLVGIVFMELRASTRAQRLAAVAGLAWLTILIGLTITDVLTRWRG
jgi:cytochrome c oxidase subunit 4